MTIHDAQATSPVADAPADEAIGPPTFAVENGALRGDISFSFKVLATGRWYRIEPARWPGQPRFWGFRVFRCAAGNMPDPAQRAWFGAGGMAREDLPEAARAIREDLEGWLAGAGQEALRHWILEG